jgi:hypothetical protein
LTGGGPGADQRHVLYSAAPSGRPTDVLARFNPPDPLPELHCH